MPLSPRQPHHYTNEPEHQAFFDAAIAGDVAAVEKTLAQNPWAYQWKDTRFTTQPHSSTFNPTHDWGAFMFAAANGKVDVMKALVAHDNGTLYQQTHRDEPLHVAARHGQDKVIDYLLSQRITTNGVSYEGTIALHEAAIHGHTLCAEKLLNAAKNPKRDIDKQTDSGFSALIYAAQQGHKDFVDLLIARGANLDLLDEYGRTALIAAAEQGNEDIAKSLVDAGANSDLNLRPGKPRKMKTGISSVMKDFITAARTAKETPPVTPLPKKSIPKQFDKGTTRPVNAPSRLRLRRK